MMRMNREEFEKAVARALDDLPEEIAALLDNVVVVVEDEPTEEDLVEAGLDPKEETLFGLYQGVALTERGAAWANMLPDRIVVYRLPLLDACADRIELIREIRDTVVHEVGHFFGLDEDDLP
ncbi:MAG: metallopeptidase family protein [Acidobacteria bacterium]|nr:metallopeptidase family protein [Acidobacteriota bacterium]